MYSSEFLKSLGLDPKIWNLNSPFKDLVDQDNDLAIEAEKNITVNEQVKTNLPIRCLNCVHGKSLDIGDFCEAAEIFIKDLEKEISCEAFRRIQCKNCGLYEDGLCVAKDGKIAKNPEDECVYDVREFL